MNLNKSSLVRHLGLDLATIELPDPFGTGPIFVCIELNADYRFFWEPFPGASGYNIYIEQDEVETKLNGAPLLLPRFNIRPDELPFGAIILKVEVLFNGETIGIRYRGEFFNEQIIKAETIEIAAPSFHVVEGEMLFGAWYIEWGGYEEVFQNIFKYNRFVFEPETVFLDLSDPAKVDQPLEAPTNYAVIPDDINEDRFEATWDAVTGADGYNIYIDDGTGYIKVNDELITETSETVFIDEGQYDSYVTSVKIFTPTGQHLESETSNIETFVVGDPGYLNSGELFTLDNGGVGASGVIFILETGENEIAIDEFVHSMAMGGFASDMNLYYKEGDPDYDSRNNYTFIEQLSFPYNNNGNIDQPTVLSEPLILQPNTKYSFHFQLTNASANNFRYTSVAQTVNGDGGLDYTADSGVNAGFTSFFSPRSWNGIIKYRY